MNIFLRLKMHCKKSGHPIIERSIPSPYLCRISLANRQHKTHAKKVATLPVFRKIDQSPKSKKKSTGRTEKCTSLNQNCSTQYSLA